MKCFRMVKKLKILTQLNKNDINTKWYGHATRMTGQ